MDILPPPLAAAVLRVCQVTIAIIQQLEEVRTIRHVNILSNTACRHQAQLKCYLKPSLKNVYFFDKSEDYLVY